eukprot:scaffold2601_cov127-Skeletonema_dohrnii-CCMP3373.AAC.1
MEKSHLPDGKDSELKRRRNELRRDCSQEVMYPFHDERYTTQDRGGGVCRAWDKFKQCRYDGCTTRARPRRSVPQAKWMKRCSKKGHTNHIVNSVQEIWKDKICSTEGCTAKAALRKECTRSMVLQQMSVPKMKRLHKLL